MTDFSTQITNFSPEKRELLKLLLKRKGIQASGIQTIPRRKEDELCHLSFAQARLWFLDQLYPNSPFYNIFTTYGLSGTVNVAVLQKSLNELVCRHTVLRTTFLTVKGQPVQIIAPQLTLSLPVVNLQALPESQQQAEVLRLANEEAQQPFNLAQDPLLRTKLLQLSSQEQVLLLTMHHIVSDGWSVGILVEELTRLYQAFCDGSASPLPPLPIQYGDFAVWQRQWLQGEVLEKQLSYWKQQLDSAPLLLQLPTDRPRPSVQTYRGTTKSFVLPPHLSKSLRTLSSSEDATLFMTLLAAFKVLLYRYTNQEDIIVGSPIAGRNYKELEGLIGFFANTLVLRTNLSNNPSFRELLRQVREVTLEAYAHQDLPFEKLVEELQPERDLSHNPLFQVLFAFENTPTLARQVSGLNLHSTEVNSQTAKFDLSLSMQETEQGLIGGFVYNTDLFDAATISRMLEHLQILLEDIAVHPDKHISNLSLLSEYEQHQLLVEWNDKQLKYPQHQCIHQLFEAQVEKTPDTVAVVFEQQQLTYRELNARANQLAHHLQGLGVGPEVLVGICLERSLEMIVGLLGILKAGGAYIPLDPTYPQDRLAFMLNHARVSVLLTQQRLVEGLPECSAEIICLDDNFNKTAFGSKNNFISGTTPENAVYVIYTSGSTGRPKGVLVSHLNLVSFFQATQASFHFFDESDVWTLFHSYAFDFSVWEIWGALLYGGRLVIVPYLVSRSPATFYELLCTQQVTVLSQTPSAFRQLIQAEESVHRTQNLNLRLVVFGGEALERQSLRPWLARHGDQCPQLVNMYGITETTIQITYCPVETADLKTTSGNIIGHPIPDWQIYVLDTYLQPVPIGVPGEIYIGGIGLARGYFNQPELTAEKFIPNPFNHELGTRLYKTGDLARYKADGNIEYLGRIDQQVKIRGFRIELGEIEAVLGRHPQVRDCVVIVREDMLGDKRLVAYLVTNQEPAPSINNLRHFLQQQLPEYMMPSAFVFLKTLPLSPNGKVDRKTLPAPDSAHSDLQATYVAAQSPTEMMLAGLYAQLLRVERVGINDNFFKIGGHSLLAAELILRVREIFKVELPLRYLFEKPTVASLAGCIEDLVETGSPCQSSLVPIQPADSKRPFFCVHSAGGTAFDYVDLAHYLGSDQPFYGLQAPGIYGETEPYTQMGDLASHYIREIQVVQPQGPYLLGGWSLGGVVAFEMAQQLQRQGHEVAMLAILDTPAPLNKNVTDEDDENEFADIVAWFTQELAPSDRKNLIELSPNDFQQIQPNERFKNWLKHMKKYKIILSSVSLSHAYSLLRVCRINYQAARNYIPQVYQGHITLFRASERSADIGLELGWGKLVTGQIDIHIVPGKHNSIAKEPHVQVLAKELKACLQKVYLAIEE